MGVFATRTPEGQGPCLWLDATLASAEAELRLAIREGGRIASVAAMIAVAADRDGRRETAGLHIGSSEAETRFGRPS